MTNPLEPDRTAAEEDRRSMDKNLEEVVEPAADPELTDESGGSREGS